MTNELEYDLLQAAAEFDGTTLVESLRRCIVQKNKQIADLEKRLQDIIRVLDHYDETGDEEYRQCAVEDRWRLYRDIYEIMER